MLPMDIFFPGHHSKFFLNCFLCLSTQNCPTVGKLPKLLRRAKQSKKVRTTQEVARHWKQSSVFGDQVTYACPSGNAIGTWVINCSCFFPTGQDDWNGTRPSLKAPPARPVKGAYREHPYGRY